MPYTEIAKNLMLDALSAAITHVGLFQAGSGKSVTSSGANFTCTSHGYSVGDLVAFSGLTGGTGLVAGDPYFIKTTPDANTFTIATKPSGATVTPGTNVSSGTVKKYTELSGGSPAYARKSIAYAAAALGVADDTTNGAVIDVPACTVDAVGEFTALTSGNLETFATVTPEVFAGQGTYSVTDSKNDLNK